MIKTNLRELNNISPAPFTNEVIINQFKFLESNQIILTPYYNMSYEDIPIDNIIGHAQGYGELPWGASLNNLPRMNGNLQKLIENPEYYLSGIKKDSMSFNKIGNNYFIEDGKHRAVIARFLKNHNKTLFINSSPLRNVLVFNRIIDYQFMSFEREIKRLSNAYPYLMFDLNYEHENNKECLFINNKDNIWVEPVRYTRGELEECFSIFNNPTIFNKILSNNKTYNLIKIRDCFGI